MNDDLLSDQYAPDEPPAAGWWARRRARRHAAKRDRLESRERAQRQRRSTLQRYREEPRSPLLLVVTFGAVGALLVIGLISRFSAPEREPLELFEPPPIVQAPAPTVTQQPTAASILTDFVPAFFQEGPWESFVDVDTIDAGLEIQGLHLYGESGLLAGAGEVTVIDVATQALDGTTDSDTTQRRLVNVTLNVNDVGALATFTVTLSNEQGSWLITELTDFSWRGR